MALTIKQALQQGVAAHSEGKLEDAERFYRAILQSQPQHPDANHNLGVLAVSVNKLDAALPLFKTALEANPKIGQFWLSYIDALIRENHLGKAKEVLREAKKQGISGKEFIEMDSRLASSYGKVNVNDISPSQNQLSRLFAQYQRGQFASAEGLATSIIEKHPDHQFAWKILGGIFRHTRKHAKALEANQKAIALLPQDAEAHFNLGNTLQDLGKLEEALESYKKAILLKPDYAKAHYNLGNALQSLGRLDEAEASYSRAIAAKPDFAEAHNNLGNTFQELLKLDEAETSYKKAIKLNPYYAEAYNSLLFMNASMRFDGTRYGKQARAFSNMVSRRIDSPYSNWLCNKRPSRLRVGFVSGDLKTHPVGIFIEGLLKHFQTSSIELFGYPTSTHVDDATLRIKNLFHSWVPLAEETDEDAAQTIHNDGINILIDLSGHTQRNKLPVFGWKPAPIQVSWLGYFASTGLSAMDYILGDPFVTPHEEAHHFSEKIWQLPESYLCFTPPAQNIPVSSLPSLSNGVVTFGCFNQLLKMTDEVVSVRAEILHSVPNSKLFLKDEQLGYQSGREKVAARFLVHGISEERLIMEGRSPREIYLSCYNRVDLALSPFPYGGGTTSVEGLWMGVPVITKKGDYFLSHLGESIAHNSNLSEWIAGGNEDYISKAIEFSSDLIALQRLRQGLREKLLRTPLFDLSRFATNLEHALWNMNDSIDY